MVIFVGVVFSGHGCHGRGKNSDKPKLGEYRFPLKKLWEIEKVGEDYIGTIHSMVVSNDGKICVYDWKILKYFILDVNGKLLHTFGKRGEGPGEIRRLEQAPVINAGNKIAVLDNVQIHFFDWNGKFVKTESMVSGTAPILFLDEDTYITAPRSSLAVQEGLAKVEKINLKTKERKVITTFSMYKGGVLANNQGQAAVVFGGITPRAEVTMYDDKLLYAMSDVYKINMTDKNGKMITSFSLDRARGKIKQKDIVDRLMLRAKGKAPKELLERLAKTLPTEETYFTRILVHKGLIYLFKSGFYATNINQIDIFSFNGEYLYKGVLMLEDGYNIRNTQFTDKCIYLSLENEEGDNVLAKYTVTVPPRVNKT